MKTRLLSTLSLIVFLGISLGAQDRNSVPYKESHPEFQPKTDLRPDKTVLLYPEGQAAGKGIVEDGVEITFGPTEDNGLRGEEICNKSGNRRNVGDDARMDLYFPEKPNGLMVIIAPGGGYSFRTPYAIAATTRQNGASRRLELREARPAGISLLSHRSCIRTISQGLILQSCYIPESPFAAMKSATPKRTS